MNHSQAGDHDESMFYSAASRPSTENIDIITARLGQCHWLFIRCVCVLIHFLKHLAYKLKLLVCDYLRFLCKGHFNCSSMFAFTLLTKSFQNIFNMHVHS